MILKRYGFAIFLFHFFLLFNPHEAFAAVQKLNNQTGTNQSFQNDSNVTIFSASNIHTIEWQGLLPVSRGGTGVGSFTPGSLLFYSGTTFAEDNSNLFWDNTNKRLGIGSSTPGSTLDVSGTVKATSIESANDASINSLIIGLGGGGISTNSVVGQSAMELNTSGSENIAFGQNTLYSNNGNRNSALGFRSMSNTTSGSENTSLGWYSFIANTTGSGNVVIGRNAAAVQANGINSLTNAHSGVYIGKNVRGYSNSDNQSIVIGADAIGAGSFKAVIGNEDITDVYLGSASANADVHVAKMYLGSSSVPGCIIMGDTSGGLGYITVDNGSLTVSTTPPSACQ